jgi:hypothetical protein
MKDELRIRLDSIQSKANECLSSHGAACELDPQDMIPDYAFRVRMPVRINSFETDAALRQAKKDLATHRSLIPPFKQTWEKSAFVHASCPDITKCPQWIEVQQAINADNEVISNLQAHYPESLKRAIFEEWIDYPSSKRCLPPNIHSKECLTEGQLKEWYEKIVVM